MTEALAQTYLQPLRSYAVHTFPLPRLRTLYRRYARQLRRFCYAFYTSAVYVRYGAVLGRCGN